MNPRSCPRPHGREWAALETHAAKVGSVHLRQLFADDPSRFESFSIRLDDLLLDWSKTRVTGETMQLLAVLARAEGVEERRDAMFAGEPINETENRAVLHVALRNLSDRPIITGGRDVMPEVRRELGRVLEFADSVRNRTFVSCANRPFTDVINIGIGGSDLGPAMATAALAPYHDGPRVHFVSNVDGAHLADTIRRLDPATTLVIVASKTFTTLETMTNARSARRWIAGALGEAAVGRHFAAVSTAIDRVKAFGIREDRTFGFWDWVGGRYSLWSAIGLPLAIATGRDDFTRFLEGGAAIDEHFRTAPILANAPMVMGLIGVWQRDILQYPSRAILPYDQRLALLPAYLQQLDMESNGKRVTLAGEVVDWATGPIVWGEPGTNGQHAFFQLLHQGTDVVPCEFLVAAEGHEPELADHHAILVANCLAQAEALMRGRTEEEAAELMEAAGRNEAAVERLAPHRTFPGNRPSMTIAYRRLDPFTLGRLIALYEHRVFVEGALWGINSFDQWGVELGKELAGELLPMVRDGDDAGPRDASTAGLLAHLRALRKT